ncbi:aryl-sulfate sulfotransferase [Pimelobacter simplex]|uniref:aryl-sulfate sulfotransferase n=1 Tax=Nocardioides simplex TaxID=2045 RepID=UPI0019335929|nr:aryl-sulfate sulfotransferase [Pimelobacter simplex]
MRACAVLLALLLALLGVPAASAEPPPTVEVSVTGDGVALRPVFDPDVSRYGVATSAATGGRLTVSATTSDPAGVVRVDGSVVTGPTDVSGLVAGDEVSVIVDDAAGHHAYALVYLPAAFPEITTVVDEPGVSEGNVLLTLGTVAVALDRNGVPVQLRDFGTSVADLKPAPHGHYTVMVRRPGPVSDWDLVELDEQFRDVATSRTVGLVNTDNHDVILRPDGSRLFVAYEPDAGTGLVDAVIQEVDPAGTVVHTWDSGDHLDPAVETTAGGSADWAHINAIQLLPDGDVLASFRHLSAALRIAWSDHDGFERGDVVWRFGGRLNDFDFVDDPHGGPCAQHTVNRLPNGHLLVFDNGSAVLGANPSYCVDPADRLGPTVNRALTRVTEYALDETAMTATLVRSWSHGSRFAYFAGSARRLPGGNTLVDWAADKQALVSEVDPDGTIVWELKAPTALSYRAEKAEVPDRTDPVVTVSLPGAGRYDRGDQVVPQVRCTDRGGSSLQSCTWAASLPTGAVGPQVFTVTAVDGAGNATVVSRAYDVISPEPVIAVRSAAGWAPARTLRLPRRGVVRRAVLRVTNTSVRPSALAVGATKAGAGYRVRYLAAGRDVTAEVRAGTWRTAVLAPGEAASLEVVVKRRSAAALPRRRVEVRVVRATAVPATTSSSVRLGLRGR